MRPENHACALPGKAEKRPECVVAAGDFLDSYMPDAFHKKTPHGGTNPGYTYFHEYAAGMGALPKPYRWAWHAYTDGSQTRESRLKNRPKQW